MCRTDERGALRSALALASLLFLGAAPASGSAGQPSPLPEGVFPIGVWLQQPKHATRYKDLGINLYVGLWQGPTSAQLAELKKARMPVICEQNDLALSDGNGDVIVGWLHKDEPDNAQPVLGRVGMARAGWGSPIPPAEVQERYRQIRARDARRPVLLNLGKGVAWDAWKGRGGRTGHPEDYPDYVKAADIVSFDIYPAAEKDPALAGRLELVASGTARLVRWAGPERTVWTAIGASRVKNARAPVAPEDIRAQVWMSIIRGSRGIIYFVHEFEPRFKEASWFDDPPLAESMARLNAEVQGLSRAILGRDVGAVASVTLTGPGERAAASENLAVTSRRMGCATYVFAASLSRTPFRATIKLDAVGAPDGVDVLNEQRTLAVSESGFSDDFGPYAVHLYRTRAAADCPG